MPFTGGDVEVAQVSDTDWRLLRPLTYQGAQTTFEVPAGFITDFASVPRIFVWLFPTYGRYTKAAILHDFLCRNPDLADRADADGVFRRAMRELGVPLLRRWMMWAAVRAASGLSRIRIGQLAAWLVVALSSALFLAVPAVVVLLWLGLYALVEWALYLLLKPFGRAGTARPTVLPAGRRTRGATAPQAALAPPRVPTGPEAGPPA
ncbi:DUF1353 domain-containing protein [Streptomyces palmae]|uniref:DUF1353 domain-containing protein n=1 Tax=Streptomyces palmae TaxID=1701085 RepID=A0A4Z0HAR2_9ACTN|nr:DUF1353 domain-containing protein [Streptomyces palmae]TGB12036.1 DUF1353 domain-containing protein [Streptomyces palmae]